MADKTTDRIKEYDDFEKKIDKKEIFWWETPDGDKEAYNDTMTLLDSLGISYEQTHPIDGGYALAVYLKK